MTIFELIVKVLLDESVLSERSCRYLAGSILYALKLKGYTILPIKDTTSHEEPNETHAIP